MTRPIQPMPSIQEIDLRLAENYENLAALHRLRAEAERKSREAQIAAESASLEKNTGTYTVAEVAKLYSRDERTIRDRAKKGQIPGTFRDGREFRFPKNAIDAHLKGIKPT